MFHNFVSLKRLLKEAKQQSMPAFFYGYLILKSLSKADHNKVKKIVEKMVINHPVGYYYSAQSDFLCGHLDKAEDSIKRIPQFNCISDVVYLYSDILIKQNRKDEAKTLLEDFAQNYPRKKTWVHLANLVQSELDFKHFIHLIEHVRQTTLFLNNDDLAIPISNAALRANLPHEALKIWENKTSKRNDAQKKKSKETFNDKLAKNALADLKKVLDFNSIEFFLVSGTLLGCIREQRLLSHDKDIDVGVWDNHSYERLSNILGSSGYFYIVPTRTKELIMLRHVNGISIDVFIHHRERNDYWHAGVKLKWHNSPFELTETKFLDGIYLIPKNYDLYLTENYGDWKTPKTKFDSAFDTPNAEVINQSEMDVYLLKNSL